MLRFTDGQPKEFGSLPGVLRSFCAVCGSPIAYRSNRRPEIVDLYVGTLNDATAIVPWCHVQSSEQLPWFESLTRITSLRGITEGSFPYPA